MLDNMSQNDPTEYKKFVAKNVDEGFKDIKEKKAKEDVKRQVAPKARASYKIKAELKEVVLQEETRQSYEGMLLMEQKESK